MIVQVNVINQSLIPSTDVIFALTLGLLNSALNNPAQVKTAE